MLYPKSLNDTHAAIEETKLPFFECCLCRDITEETKIQF